MIYVHGHTSPDTDSILSSLVWTRYLTDTGTQAQTICLGKPNNETMFILDKLSISAPEIQAVLPDGSDIFLIDHNNIKESIPNRDNYNIVGIIDHHNLGGVSTNGPVFVRMDMVGCSSTVIWGIFQEKGYKIPADSAKMMISAIVSDTLLFKSPTTTDRDIQAVEDLQKIAGIDNLEDYAMQMFDAKSDLGDMPAKELVQVDFKKQEVGNKILGIGVLETTNPGYAINRKEEILTAMSHIQKEQNIDVIMFCVIDIINEKNTTICLEAEQNIVSQVFDTKFENNEADLGNRVSRKKQIMPQMKEFVANI